MRIFGKFLSPFDNDTFINLFIIFIYKVILDRIYKYLYINVYCSLDLAICDSCWEEALELTEQTERKMNRKNKYLVATCLSLIILSQSSVPILELI